MQSNAGHLNCRCAAYFNFCGKGLMVILSETVLGAAAWWNSENSEPLSEFPAKAFQIIVMCYVAGM
jgi:hypothetical protein